MPGANENELVKFVKDEIAETETALAFVVKALETATQHNRVYQRKKAEYEGVLWALNAVLDIATEDAPAPTNTEEANAS